MANRLLKYGRGVLLLGLVLLMAAASSGAFHGLFAPTRPTAQVASRERVANAAPLSNARQTTTRAAPSFDNGSSSSADNADNDSSSSGDNSDNDSLSLASSDNADNDSSSGDNSDNSSSKSSSSDNSDNDSSSSGDNSDNSSSKSSSSDNSDNSSSISSDNSDNGSGSSSSSSAPAGDPDIVIENVAPGAPAPAPAAAPAPARTTAAPAPVAGVLAQATGTSTGGDTIVALPDNRVVVTMFPWMPAGITVTIRLIDPATAPPAPGTRLGDLIFQIDARDAAGSALAELPAEVNLDVTYGERELAGLNPANVSLYWLDPADRQWKTAPKLTTNPAGNTVAASVTRTGVYVLSAP